MLKPSKECGITQIHRWINPIVFKVLISQTSTAWWEMGQGHGAATTMAEQKKQAQLQIWAVAVPLG